MVAGNEVLKAVGILVDRGTKSSLIRTLVPIGTRVASGMLFFGTDLADRSAGLPSLNERMAESWST